jgi:hypothetical protein
MSLLLIQLARAAVLRFWTGQTSVGVPKRPSDRSEGSDLINQLKLMKLSSNEVLPKFMRLAFV